MKQLGGGCSVSTKSSRSGNGAKAMALVRHLGRMVLAGIMDMETAHQDSGLGEEADRLNRLRCRHWTDGIEEVPKRVTNTIRARMRMSNEVCPRRARVDKGGRRIGTTFQMTFCLQAGQGRGQEVEDGRKETSHLLYPMPRCVLSFIIHAKMKNILVSRA